MNEKLKTWLKALRSGKYTQCKNNLTDGTSYCCMGVLCMITPGYVTEGQWFKLDGVSYAITPKQDTLRDLGFRSMIGTLPAPLEASCAAMSAVLGTLNDKHGYTFEQIADWVELHKDVLLVPEEA